MTDSTSKSSVNSGVSFAKSEEGQEDKCKRHLTAKYDRRQRLIINMRMKVEDYIYDNLRKLYNCKEEDPDPDCEVDLDKMTCLKSEDEKRLYIEESLASCPSPEEAVKTFTNELLKRLRRL